MVAHDARLNKFFFFGTCWWLKRKNYFYLLVKMIQTIRILDPLLRAPKLDKSSTKRQLVRKLMTRSKNSLSPWESLLNGSSVRLAPVLRRTLWLTVSQASNMATSTPKSHKYSCRSSKSSRNSKRSMRKSRRSKWEKNPTNFLWEALVNLPKNYTLPGFTRGD